MRKGGSVGLLVGVGAVCALVGFGAGYWWGAAGPTDRDAAQPAHAADDGLDPLERRAASVDRLSEDSVSATSRAVGSASGGSASTPKLMGELKAKRRKSVTPDSLLKLDPGVLNSAIQSKDPAAVLGEPVVGRP